MTTFTLKENAILPFRNAKRFDPQKIGDAEEELMQRTPKLNQRARARIWVGEAKDNRRHVAHSFYNWDVDKAAMSHWVSQTIAMWGVIRIIADDTGRSEPGFISLKSPANGHFRSFTNGEVKSSIDLQLANVRKLEREVRALLARFKQFSAVCVHLESAKAAAEVLRSQYERAMEESENEEQPKSRSRRARKSEGDRPTA